MEILRSNEYFEIHFYNINTPIMIGGSDYEDIIN